jgi:hypothetical protein
MFRRILLSASIAIPLYLSLAIRQTPPSTDSATRTLDITGWLARQIGGEPPALPRESFRSRSFLERE